jgi:hypothetical protein
LIVTNTPAAAIAREQALDLIATVQSIPRFIAANEEELALVREGVTRRPPISWSKPDCRVEIFYIGAPEDEDARVWDVPKTLTAACATGPAARPGAYVADERAYRVVHEEEGRRLDRYEEVLGVLSKGSSRVDGGGLTPPVSVEYDLEIARAFATSVVAKGVPMGGVSELDLRFYLYALYPKSARGSGNHRRLLASLALYFAFLSSEGIECPWAPPILGDVAAVEKRVNSMPPRGDEAATEEWVFRLVTDLWVRELVDVASDVPLGTTASRNPGALKASREWLRWRDEVIASGETDSERVHEGILARWRAARRKGM